MKANAHPSWNDTPMRGWCKLKWNWASGNFFPRQVHRQALLPGRSCQDVSDRSRHGAVWAATGGSSIRARTPSHCYQVQFSKTMERCGVMELCVVRSALLCCLFLSWPWHAAACALGFLAAGRAPLEAACLLDCHILSCAGCRLCSPHSQERYRCFWSWFLGLVFPRFLRQGFCFLVVNKILWLQRNYL